MLNKYWRKLNQTLKGETKKKITTSFHICNIVFKGKKFGLMVNKKKRNNKAKLNISERENIEYILKIRKQNATEYSVRALA